MSSVDPVRSLRAWESAERSTRGICDFSEERALRRVSERDGQRAATNNELPIHFERKQPRFPKFPSFLLTIHE